MPDLSDALVKKLLNLKVNTGPPVESVLKYGTGIGKVMAFKAVVGSGLSLKNIRH